MSLLAPLTAASDPRRAMPVSMTARFDAADAAVNSLREEQRRLQGLGFGLPRARCCKEVRSWSFVRARNQRGNEECA